ncbi:unnamed protein product [Brassica rapa subsp. trilocularis]
MREAERFPTGYSPEGLRPERNNAVAGDRTRVTRVTGGNTYHYTTTTWLLNVLFLSLTLTPNQLIPTFNTQKNHYFLSNKKKKELPLISFNFISKPSGSSSIKTRQLHGAGLWSEILQLQV